MLNSGIEFCFLWKCWNKSNTDCLSSSYGAVSFHYSLNTPQTFKPLPWPRMPFSHLSICQTAAWALREKAEPKVRASNLPENLLPSICTFTLQPPQATFDVLLRTLSHILLVCISAFTLIPHCPLLPTHIVCEDRDHCLLCPY